MIRRAARRVQTASGVVALLVANAAFAAMRVVDVDASPAIDDALPALRVTLAGHVPWGVERCAPPSKSLCAKAGPRDEAVSVRLVGAEAPAVTLENASRSERIRTAWLIVVDAGAPVAPRWQDVRLAAFAWLDAVARDGDRIAVVMLGETRPVSTTPWFTFAEREKAREALGLQALPLMALGRDEALGPVVSRAVADAVDDLPVLPTSDDLPRVVAAVFTDGRTETAQAAWEAKGSRSPVREPRSNARSRQVEIEAFWFPHHVTDPRADGTRGLLALTAQRGRVHRIDGPYRESVVRDAAALARSGSEGAIRVRIESPTASILPAIPAVEALSASGSVVDSVVAGSLPFEPESWPLLAATLVSDDTDSVLVRVPLADAEGTSPRWRVFWMPASDHKVALNPGEPVRHGALEALVATDRELALEPVEGDAWRVHIDPEAALARAQEPIDLVVYDDVTRRATPLRHDRALRLERGTWVAPLANGPRIVRLAVIGGAFAGLVAWARVRRRRGIDA